MENIVKMYEEAMCCSSREVTVVFKKDRSGVRAKQETVRLMEKGEIELVRRDDQVATYKILNDEGEDNFYLNVVLHGVERVENPSSPVAVTQEG